MNYKFLLECYDYTVLTDEEIVFLKEELKNRIFSAKELSESEIILAYESWHYRDGCSQMISSEESEDEYILKIEDRYFIIQSETNHNPFKLNTVFTKQVPREIKISDYDFEH